VGDKANIALHAVAKEGRETHQNTCFIQRSHDANLGRRGTKGVMGVWYRCHKCSKKLHLRGVPLKAIRMNDKKCLEYIRSERGGRRAAMMLLKLEAAYLRKTPVQPGRLFAEVGSQGSVAEGR